MNGESGPPSARTEGVDLEVESVLAEMLHEAQDLLPFARAVVVHLSRAPASGIGQMDAATHVLEALAWGVIDDRTGEAEFSLDRYPELLASFFQNADLLDPHSPRTAPIARAVMDALERIDSDVGE